MIGTNGFRREDRNRWEKGVPFFPADIREFLSKNDPKVVIQPFLIRIFEGEEIPLQLLEKKKTMSFSPHTIKEQLNNMKKLEQSIDLKSSLIDYQKMSDGSNARIISFRLFAGMAGIGWFNF